jgi:hypothetical protein
LKFGTKNPYKFIGEKTMDLTSQQIKDKLTFLKIGDMAGEVEIVQACRDRLKRENYIDNLTIKTIATSNLLHSFFYLVLVNLLTH